VTRVAILTRPHYRSQRFLAEGLARMLVRLGIECDVYLHGITWLEAAANRTTSLRDRTRALLAKRQLARMAQYDIFILSDAMRAFSDAVNLQPIRALQKPILHYEVFYMGGSPYWLSRLPKDSLRKFDAYLVVSDIHQCAPIAPEKVFRVGLDLLPKQPFLSKRSEFIALLDFPRRDYEENRAIQENALRQLDITTITLNGEYSFKQIESAYQQSCVAFVSFHEAFGVPIAQLQHYGSYIASPDPAWIPRHALLPAGSVFDDDANPGFTDNFRFYRDENDLVGHLRELRDIYDAATVRSRFLGQQKEYAQGRIDRLWEAIRQFT